MSIRLLLSNFNTVLLTNFNVISSYLSSDSLDEFINSSTSHFNPVSSIETAGSLSLSTLVSLKTLDFYDIIRLQRKHLHYLLIIKFTCTISLILLTFSFNIIEYKKQDEIKTKPKIILSKSHSFIITVIFTTYL